MSPRHVPVSVTELSRVPLLSALPGADLVKLAERLHRVEAAPGAVIAERGADGHVIVLSGLASADRPGAPRRLRPGEVLDLAEVPETRVTAMTPCLAVICDRATFAELIRPHVER